MRVDGPDFDTNPPRASKGFTGEDAGSTTALCVPKEVHGKNNFETANLLLLHFFSPKQNVPVQTINGTVWRGDSSGCLLSLHICTWTLAPSTKKGHVDRQIYKPHDPLLQEFIWQQ